MLKDNPWLLVSMHFVFWIVLKIHTWLLSMHKLFGKNHIWMCFVCMEVVLFGFFFFSFFFLSFFFVFYLSIFDISYCFLEAERFIFSNDYTFPGSYLAMAGGTVKGSCPLLCLPDPSGIHKVKSSSASALKGAKRSFSEILTKCPTEKCCTNLSCLWAVDTAMPKHCCT